MLKYKTSLICGEGKAEENFFNYLKSLYTNRNAKHSITVQPIHKVGHTGGSSAGVLYHAMSQCNNRDYDALVFVLDDDILHDKTCGNLYKESKQKHNRDLRKKIPLKYKCIILSPCLEHVLLQIIGQTPKQETSDCKKKFKAFTSGKEAHELSPRDFSVLFPKDILEIHRNISVFNKLIEYFSLTGDKFDAWFEN